MVLALQCGSYRHLHETLGIIGLLSDASENYEIFFQPVLWWPKFQLIIIWGHGDKPNYFHVKTGEYKLFAIVW